MSNCRKDYRQGNDENGIIPAYRSNPNKVSYSEKFGNKSHGRNDYCKCCCCCNQTENYTINVWNWDWDWDWNSNGDFF